MLQPESLNSTQLLFVSLAATEGSPSLLDMTVRELNALRVELNAALQTVGEHNIASSAHELTVQVYGPDADALWARVEPVLRLLRVPVTGTVLRRYGGPGAPEVQHTIPRPVG